MTGWFDEATAGLAPGTTGNLDPASTNKPAGSAGVAVGTGTGQHGVIPIISDLGGGMSAAIKDFWDWLNEPFTTPMTPASLTIMVGVILVAIVLWNLVLYHVRIAAEAI
jgi:hypothetical protein